MEKRKNSGQQFYLPRDCEVEGSMQGIPANNNLASSMVLLNAANILSMTCNIK